MKLFIQRFLLVAAVLIPFGVNAQTATPKYDKCLAEIMYQEAIAKNPEYARKQAVLEAETAIFTEQYIAERQARATQRAAAVVKVIPVVFHVIHEGGQENVDRSQLLNQLEILNNDFRRLNADTTNTPSVFQQLSADCEIEFRLATLDPNGNCTDGVVRVYSSLTNQARDNVKAVSYWPSANYFNIWIVKTIENINGSPGTVIGYAQFPGGDPLTDGIVLAHDFVGTIGTGGGGNSGGRPATHETGHWLNLRHIWGDDNTACTGSDFVLDTPNQADMNFSTCPSWPNISCSNAPNGEMFMNYMDYTSGNCQNMFSLGQAARMNSALTTASDRTNLWTQANLIATGTDGTPGVACAPVAAFQTEPKTICEGAMLTFNDGSYNGTIDTWSWDFPGGTPSTSNSEDPQIQYNTAGVYDVTLTVTNSVGSSTTTNTGIVIVLPAFGLYNMPYYESFETTAFPGTEYVISNEAGNAWEQNTFAAKTGINSVYIRNHTGNPTGSKDVFITPTFNYSWLYTMQMTFELAYAIRSINSTDNLKVFASTNCGSVWAQRYTKTGAALATAGLVSSAFFPTAAQWRTETVNIGTVAYNNKPNVRYKFEYTHDTGNNLFIDDINMSGTVGIDEVFEAGLMYNIYPNPSSSDVTVEFSLAEKMDVKIQVMDMLGKVVNEVVPGMLESGDYQFELPAGLPGGLYSVRLTANGYPVTRKVVIY